MESFSIRWKKSNNIPLYEQLYLHIKNEIITGRLAYCSQLPSKRKLQQNLNISQTTVENAYEQLIAEGFIESRPRSGYFVSANQEFLHHPPPSDIVTKTKKKQVKTKIAFDFSPGLINNSMFPFSSWRKLYKEALTFDNRDLLLLGPTTGEVELKEEIKKYLYQSRGVNCNIEQIIIGAGVEQLLPQLVLLLGNKKIYAIENPGYPLTNHVLTLHKRQFRLIDVDLEGAKVNDLKESGANTVYLTPSHQFPLGTVMSFNRRVQLLNWAYAKTDRYIIEDDYDSEFRYTGRPVPSLHSIGHGKKVIYLSTFSKSLIPSLRIGYMVLPEKLQKKYRREFSCYSSCVSRIDQYVLGKFMRSGQFEKHLNRMRTAYKKKIEQITLMLEPYGDIISYSGEKAGLHLLVSFNRSVCEKKIIDRARRHKIKLCGLGSFYHRGKPDKPSIVMGFANLSENELQNGLNLFIEKVVKSL